MFSFFPLSSHNYDVYEIVYPTPHKGLDRPRHWRYQKSYDYYRLPFIRKCMSKRLPYNLVGQYSIPDGLKQKKKHLLSYLSMVLIYSYPSVKLFQ